MPLRSLRLLTPPYWAGFAAGLWQRRHSLVCLCGAVWERWSFALVVCGLPFAALAGVVVLWMWDPLAMPPPAHRPQPDLAEVLAACAASSPTAARYEIAVDPSGHYLCVPMNPASVASAYDTAVGTAALLGAVLESQR